MVDLAMAIRMLLVSTFSTTLMLYSGFALAEDSGLIQEQVQIQEQVYGRELMTEQERAEYQSKMRAAKSEEEREQIRKEQHEKMQIRAKERGLSMPDEPPASGGGMGNGMGSGGGKGR